MFDSLREATAVLEGLVAELDPACLGADEAVAGLDLFSRAERLCAAGRVLCAGRAAETRAHEREGARSAADWLAKRTGQSVGEAIGTLAAARQAPAAGALDAALRAGELSGAQAAAVAEAVAVDPSCEEDLLAAARREPLKVLRQQARAAKAAGESEAALVASEEQLRQRRYLRTYTGRDGAVGGGVSPPPSPAPLLRTDTGRDGAVRGEFTLAPLDGARLLAALAVEQRVAFDAARRRGEREASEAYAADALVALAERPQGDGRATPTLVLTVDVAAFRRGESEPGERCEIQGVGPVPVTTARAVLGESFLKLVVKKGVDVTSISHLGRWIPAHVRSALQSRDPHCVVPGCGETRLLEIDHWRIPVEADGPTELDNLCRVCRAHHYKKTHKGFVLDGGPGHWRWRPPRIFLPPPEQDPPPEPDDVLAAALF